MQAVEYAKLYEVEERMWWFRGLHMNLISALRGAQPQEHGQTLMLDAGCGTGGLLSRLRAAMPDRLALGIDLDRDACAMARTKSGRPVVAGSVETLPFPDNSLDAILSADVLCHRGVNEEKTLSDFRRCLRPGGALVLNLPAYRWLLSDHDVAVDNIRRYERRDVHRQLSSAGFDRVDTFYWNTILFPLMLLRRLVLPKLRGGKSPVSDVALLPAPVEWLFRKIMALENLAVRCRVRLPFGGSILAVAIKP